MHNFIFMIKLHLALYYGSIVSIVFLVIIFFFYIKKSEIKKEKNE